MGRHSLKLLFASFLICYLVGAVCYYCVETAEPGWFDGLVKPEFFPTHSSLMYGGLVLCGLLALSLYIIWETGGSDSSSRMGFRFFFLGLLLNIIWFVVFFQLHSVFVALIIMVMLLAVWLSDIMECFRHAVLAGIFMIPVYLILLLAAYANFLIFQLNITAAFWGYL